jgi:hypothetical protein
LNRRDKFGRLISEKELSSIETKKSKMSSIPFSNKESERQEIYSSLDSKMHPQVSSIFIKLTLLWILVFGRI